MDGQTRGVSLNGSPLQYFQSFVVETVNQRLKKHGLPIVFDTDKCPVLYCLNDEISRLHGSDLRDSPGSGNLMRHRRKWPGAAAWDGGYIRRGCLSARASVLAGSRPGCDSLGRSLHRSRLGMASGPGLCRRAGILRLLPRQCSTRWRWRLF